MAKSEVAIVVALIALLFGASSVLFYHEPGPANVSCNQANYVNTVGNPSTCAQLPPIGPYNYIINHTGSNYNAYDAEGLLVKQSTDFVTTLNFTMASSGAKVFIATGSYVMAHQVTYSVNNIILQGAGSATNISLSSSFNVNPFTITGANWIVTELRFDARNIVTGNSHGTLIFNGANDTISFSFFNKGDHGQIVLNGNNDQAISNLVTNSNDDGIIAQTGRHQIIDSNVIHKTTNHNCISIVGKTIGDIISHNECLNSGAHGIALENLAGAGHTNFGTVIQENYIESAHGYGITIYAASSGVSSASSTVITGNTIVSSGYYGFYGQSGVGVIFSGNIINITGTVLAGTAAIRVPNAGTINYTITNNEIISAGYSGAEIFNVNGLVFSNNEVTNYLTKAGGYYGLEMQSITNFIVTGNTFQPLASATSGYGIRIDGGTASSGIISNNIFRWSVHGRAISFAVTTTDVKVEGNVINGWSIGITETEGGSSDYNTFAFNDLRNSVTTKFQLKGTHDVVFSNVGYNPKGTITTAFDNNAGLNINDTGGGTATPKNNTALTNIWSFKTVYITIASGWTAGHTLIITVGGTNILTLAAAIPAGTVYTVYLSPGQTFLCQFQTSKATFVVEGQ